MKNLFRNTFIVLILILIGVSQGLAQAPNRSSEHNVIGWYMYFGDHKLSDKWSIHTEYQWRRNHLIKTWQQSLLRAGLNYQLNKQVMLTGGYGWILTFPYSRRPIASTGSPVPEHRIYEQIQIKNPVGRADISHRFRLEQRWIGKLKKGEGNETFGWNYVNRIRYQFRIAFPLKGNTIDEKEFFIAAYDELFMGFGKKVANNIFDQNRLYAALGYRMGKNTRMEIGYLNQIVQHGKPDPYSLKPVYEYNNGLQVSVTHNFDLSKKED